MRAPPAFMTGPFCSPHAKMAGDDVLFQAHAGGGPPTGNIWPDNPRTDGTLPPARSAVPLPHHAVANRVPAGEDGAMIGKAERDVDRFFRAGRKRRGIGGR